MSVDNENSQVRSNTNLSKRLMTKTRIIWTFSKFPNLPKITILWVLYLIHTKCFCYSAQIICQNPKEMSEANNCLFQERIDHIRKCDSRHILTVLTFLTIHSYSENPNLTMVEEFGWAWEIPRECVGRLRAIQKTPREEPQCDLACGRDSGVPSWNEAWRRTRGVW